MRRIYFEVETPLKRRIRITKEYWELIITFKHPNMRGRENEVIETLKDPDFIRRGKKDKDVYLYYRKSGNRFVCVVCKHLNGEGFIITTYITDRVKEGEEIWRRS